MTRKKLTKEQIVMYILISLFVIIPTIIFGVLRQMDATKFSLRSGYAGYELGYQPVILDGKYFTTKDTTKPESAIFEGELVTSNKYKIDKLTKQVTNAEKDLLKKGRYDLEVYTKDQSDRESLLISVFDRLEPIVYCEYNPLKIPDTTVKTLSKYIFVSDYDEDITINVYKEDNVLYFVVVDSSGNKAIKEVNYKIVKDVKEQTPIPEMEGMCVRENQLNRIGNKEDYNKIIEEANKLHDRLIHEEEQLQKRLLKDDYEDYKAEEEEKHREFKKQQQELITQNKPMSKPVVVKPSKPENKEDSSEASKEEEKENTNSSISSEQKPKPEPNSNRPNNNNNTNNNSQNSSSITRPTRPENNEQEKPNKPKPVQPTEPTACEIPKGYLTTKDENKVENTNGFLITWKEATKCGKRVYKPIVHEGVFKTEKHAIKYAQKGRKVDEVDIDETTIKRQYDTTKGGWVITDYGYRTALTENERVKWMALGDEADASKKIGKIHHIRLAERDITTEFKETKSNQIFINNLVNCLKIENYTYDRVSRFETGGIDLLFRKNN